MQRAFWVFIVALACSLTAQRAVAHKADYIDDTLVFETLEAGEAEPEYFFDVGHRDSAEEGDGRTGFQRHTFAFEYGITDRWMIDARTSFEADSGESLDFDNLHIESRYRFFDEGHLPVDLALSAEVFWESSDVFGIAPRLILSKDFGALNVTLNLTEELILQPIRDSEFEMAVGTRYDLSPRFRVGAELQYAPEAHEVSLIPQVAFIFPHDVTVKFGYSHGFDETEENFVRGGVEVEF